MKKLLLLLIFLVLSVSLFAKPKNTFGAGVSAIGIIDLEEDKRDAFAVGGYLDEKLVLGKETGISMVTLCRTDIGYSLTMGDLAGVCGDLFAGAGVLLTLFGGFEFELGGGLGLFTSLSNEPIFDVTAGLFTSLGYNFGEDDSFIFTLSSTVAYGFLFKAIYFTAALGAGIRF